MKREEMTCAACIYAHHYSLSDYSSVAYSCRRESPAGPPISASGWCGQGEWHEWSEVYQEWIPYKWGEWEIKDYRNDR